MDTIQQAVGKFGHGCNCSQAILEAFGPEFGMSPEDCHRISSGFGGGMRTGEACGAVTGAFMVLGLKYGPQEVTDPSKEAVNERVIAFSRKFVDRFGGLRCKELLNCDIATEAGMRTAQEGNYFKTICPALVEAAAGILAEELQGEAGSASNSD